MRHWLRCLGSCVCVCVCVSVEWIRWRCDCDSAVPRIDSLHPLTHTILSHKSPDPTPDRTLQYQPIEPSRAPFGNPSSDFFFFFKKKLVVARNPSADFPRTSAFPATRTRPCIEPLLPPPSSYSDLSPLIWSIRKFQNQSITFLLSSIHYQCN